MGALTLELLTSFYCDVTIQQLIDGPFDLHVIMKVSANRRNAGPFAKGQLAVELTIFPSGPVVRTLSHCNHWMLNTLPLYICHSFFFHLIGLLPNEKFI